MFKELFKKLLFEVLGGFIEVRMHLQLLFIFAIDRISLQEN